MSDHAYSSAQTYLAALDEWLTQQEKRIYPLRLLEITRLIRTVVPEASEITVELDPIRVIITKIHTKTGEFLANTDNKWFMIDRTVLGAAENHLTAAHNESAPQTMGWRDVDDCDACVGDSVDGGLDEFVDEFRVTLMSDTLVGDFARLMNDLLPHQLCASRACSAIVP